ncbi:MAG: alpha-glucosidase [Thiofilum sp.]|uniref:glycoside hydrolase family 13 protein n=1 Tax=Thiofilum sp. TaxID=2212733 RepID=UPI0025F20E05|nr:alpha-glucosidase [Thiofilum sp.]MBK8454717.1 alpha-glucosidase [Thiofilum sp.]
MPSQSELKTWWKEAVVYQIYPRSFMDSNGDGIGDLAGIIQKLDYLKNLGIDVIWLSPHFDSPNADNGYDIRDYRKVMAEFGTMDDFDQLLAQMQQRGMKLIIDLVVNHTSDEHYWFVESKKSKDNPYRDYYIWRDGQNNTVPNNYPSFFGGSAWEKDKTTRQYYLHYFAKKQPDLNWDNPQVRAEVYDLMRFWLDKGVSGFRMDVIPLISKQTDLPDLSPEQLARPELIYADGPHVHEYLQEMNREVLAHYDTMTVGEALGITFEQAPLFTDARRQELNMIFHFDLVRLDREVWRKLDWTLPAVKAMYGRIDAAAGSHGWNTTFLTNHDNPRTVSHFGDDSPPWRSLSAKALATMMFAQRGTPFLYQGDELGMTNYPFQGIEDYDDVEVKGQWQDFVLSGKVSAEEYLTHLRQTSRDNARTPMQWNTQAQGGFTTGKPWLAVNPNYLEINAEAQIHDPSSVYQHHQRLIALRKANPVLIYGAYHDLDPEHHQVYAFTRTLEEYACLTLINFSREAITYQLPESIRINTVLLDNGAQLDIPQQSSHSLTLQPWQATIYSLS